MSNITPPANPVFPAAINLIDVTDRLMGGPGGILNQAAAQLDERTLWLKKQIDDLVTGALTAEYADRLKTPRTITMTGDGSWAVTFDGSGNVSGVLTLANSGVVAGTWPMTTVDAKGRVTAGRALAAVDIPVLDWSKITSGRPVTLAGYGITDAAPSANPLFTGNVGIGTTMPQVAMQLGGGGAYAELRLRRSLDAQGAQVVGFFKSRGSELAPTAVAMGDDVGGVYFSAHDGVAFRNGAAFEAVVDGAPSGSNVPMTLKFGTARGAGSGNQERMRINSLGRVLIGKSTDDGTALVQVAGAVSADALDVRGAGTVAIFASDDATVANNAGMRVVNIASSAAASRQTMLLLDPSGADGGGVDYAVLRMYGDGTAELVNHHPGGVLGFGTNAIVSVRINAAGRMLVSKTADDGIGVLQAAGFITADTPPPGDNSRRLATTEHVRGAIAALVASSPTALDTLNELATALGNDPNFATTITNALAGKQPIDATLTALSGITTAADRLIYATGADTFAVTPLTAFVRTLLDDADAAAARATLGAAAVSDLGSYIKHFNPGAALPVTDIGPIWHDDYNSVMTWQVFTANGAAYTGYASVLIGSLLLDTQPTARAGYVKSGVTNLSRTTYAALRAWAMHNGRAVAVGSWLAGNLQIADNADGVTFRIWDIRGETVSIFDDGRGRDSSATFGTFAGDTTRSHTHTGTTDVQGAHTHGVTDPGHAHGRGETTSTFNVSAHDVPVSARYGVAPSPTDWAYTGIVVQSAGAHSHAFTTAATGGAETRAARVPLLASIKF